MRGSLGSAAKEVGWCDEAVHEGELVPTISRRGQPDEMGTDDTMGRLVKVGLFGFKNDILSTPPSSMLHRAWGGSCRQRRRFSSG